MKKNLFLWLMAMLIGIRGFAQSAQYVTYGDTTTYSTSSQSPLPGYYGYHKSAVMYTADELALGAGSMITEVAWQTGSATSGTLMSPFSIYLLETSDDDIAATTVWADLISSATLVYSGECTTIANSWTNFTLTTPFTYNGSNLVVITVGQGCSTNGGCSKAVKYSTTHQTQAWTFCKDNSAIPDDASMNATGANVYHYKFNIRLGYTEGSVSCHTVSGVTVSDISTYDATISWIAPENGGNYLVQYKPATESWGSDAVITFPTTENTFNFNSTLDANTTYNVRIANYCGGNDTSAWRGVSFKTLCETMNELPLFYDFETFDATTNLPDCWDRSTSSSPTNPSCYNSTYSAYSGAHSLYFSNSDNIAIMPLVDENYYSLNSLQLRFMLREGYSDVSVAVGFMSAPNGLFVPYDTVTVPSDGYPYEYVEQTVSLSDYVGDNARIALRSITGTAYIDNLRLELIPDCPPVQDITVTALNAENATITWTGSSNNYLVRYRPVTDSVWNETDAIVEGNTATLSGLEAQTTYAVQIAPDCPETTDDSYRGITFTTTCAAFDLPYIMDFETVSDMNCWTVAEQGYSYYYDYYDDYEQEHFYPERTLYFAHGGIFCAAIGSQEGYRTMWAAPKMNESIENIRMEFYSRISSTYDEMGTLYVGVMTNPTDTATFIPVDTIPVNNTAYALQVVNFNNADLYGSDFYIAFRYDGAGADDDEAGKVYIDDITIMEIPACLEPSNVQAINITSDAATITWASEESAFNLYYKEATDSIYEYVGGINDTTYLLENLTPNTTYNFYVATLCNDGSESESQVSTFTTICAPETAPYTESFDLAAMPGCWQKFFGLAADAFNGTAPTATNGGWGFDNTQVFEGHHARLNIYGTMVKYWLVSPEIDLTDLNFPTLTFDIALTGYNNANPVTPGNQQDDKFMVIISTDNGATWSESNATVWSNASDAEHVYDQIPNSGEEVVIPLTAYAGQTIRIAFYGESTVTGGDNDLHIDNVRVDEQAACASPTQVTISELSSNSATISWTQNDDAAVWTVEYDTVGFTPGEGISITVNGTPTTTINGLEANTMYDVYVSTVCDNGDQSNPTKKTFSTECEMITELPQVWDFDTLLTGGTPSNPLPECWERTGSTYPYSYGMAPYAAHSGSRMLYFYNYMPSCAILPALDINTLPLSTLQLSFYARLSSSSYDAQLEVGVMTDPTNASTFEPVQTIQLTAEYPEIPYEVLFDSYTGTGTHIAVRNTSATPAFNYIYLDDMVLDLAPVCTRPQDLTAEATQNAATLSWSSNATTFTLYYKPATDSVWQAQSNVTLNNGSYTLTGLTPATNYDWYVETACGGADLSSEVAHFMTLMVPASLPYSTNFSAGHGWLMNNGTAVNHWTTGAANDSIPSALFVTNNDTVAHYFVTSSSTVMAEKLFTMPAGDSVHVEFDLRVGGEASANNAYDYLKVFLVPASEEFVAGSAPNAQSDKSYSTNAMDFSADSTMLGSSAFPYVAALSAGNIHISKNMAKPANAAEAKLVFLWRNDGSAGTQPGAIIFNFSISEPGSGPVVTNPTVATNDANPVGQTTATLNATITNPDNVTITAKGFEWKATTGGTFTQVAGTGTGNTFTANLTGLTASTSYTVKAFITYNGTTVYGSEKTFTTQPGDTPEPCDVPTNIVTSDITKETINVAWDNSNATSWNVQYRPQNGTMTSVTTTTNSYQITNLTPETTYEIQVQAVCADGTSEWSAIVTATTLPDGIENHLANNVSLYPNPAKEYVDIRIDGDVNVTLMEVIDVYGKVIRTVETFHETSLQTTRLNVSGLANGMYFVRVTTDNGVVTKPFVKK